jgi:hypothetical protein
MLDRDTQIRAPHSKSDKRVSVTMFEAGAALTLFFADLSGEGPVLEVRITPAGTEPLEAWQLMPSLPLYQQYARAAIAFRDDDARAALRALRKVGPTRRGLSDDAYRSVAQLYTAFVHEGERYPIKRLAEDQKVDISTASRWVTGARDRGYLPKKGRA